ncbi:immunoglobulin-like domain-containing protein [Planococcus lenghuensis]|uniref:Bacterial Ig-like domain-containing protein n=1 Tax=Planococcus lenghuensis TaxID=2213202 RepID=A0A1Q2KVS3_9BACL|nr:immunoglobulin-like domain-containing protein [Planococcus lenghuensis]AQQ52216.1 hypothetical protein B0X71_03200 [Planococcus lenghuensis]
MKRSLLLLLAAIGLVGCTEPEPEPPTIAEPASEPGRTEELPDEVAEGEFAAWIYTDQETYNLPVEEIKVTIENVGEEPMVTGEAMRLEKLEEGVWMPQLAGMEFTQEALDIQPGETLIGTVPIDFMEEPLTAGAYRVTKRVAPKSMDALTFHEIAATFEVTE